MVSILCALLLWATTASAQTTSRGHLIIAGGGPRPPEIMRTFVELAGGRDARVLVLPMAAATPERAGASGVREFERMDITARFAVLDQAAANSDTIERVFEGITGIWFPGGVQSRITAALAGTRAQRIIHRLYEQGAVIGGTSAGAAIMSDPMITGAERRPGGRRPPSDSSGDAFLTIEAENIVTTPGLGLLPGVIVDQHFLRRKRHNRLISLVLENPRQIGVGIDEATALHVTASGEWRVLGNGQVLIYDARQSAVSRTGQQLAAADLAMHVLTPGSKFDPVSRKVTLPLRR